MNAEVRVDGARGAPKSLWRLLEDHKLLRLGWTLIFYIDPCGPGFGVRPPMMGLVTIPEGRPGVARR